MEWNDFYANTKTIIKGRGRRGKLGFPTKGGFVQGNRRFPGLGSPEKIEFIIYNKFNSII